MKSAPRCGTCARPEAAHPHRRQVLHTGPAYQRVQCVTRTVRAQRHDDVERRCRRDTVSAVCCHVWSRAERGMRHTENGLPEEREAVRKRVSGVRCVRAVPGPTCERRLAPLRVPRWVMEPEPGTL